MIKLYILLMIVYTIIKTFKTEEEQPIRIAGEAIRNLLLFPYVAIKDLVELFTEQTDEPTRRDR